MGWASGFQAGSQVAKQALDTYNQVKLQQGLEAAFAKPETSQGYTAEDGKRLEELAKAGYDIVPQYAPPAEGQTQGLFTGYQAVPKAGVASFDASGGGAVEAPINVGLRQVQDYGGQRVAGEFDPTVLRGLQMREAARVVGSRGDALRASQLEAEAVRLEREAKLAPLQEEALRTQVETGRLTLAGQRQQAEAADRMNNFNVAFGEANALAAAEGRTLGAVDIANLAKQNKLDFKQENELIASFVGRAEAEVKQFRLDVEKLTQGKGLEQLLDLHKNDKRFGDGVHFVQEFDKKTNSYVLARVNEATGQIEERLPFKSKAEATAYLREEAVNPANAAIWLQNYKKTESGIEAQRAATTASNAAANLSNVRAGALKRDAATQAKLDKIEQDFEALTPDEKVGAKGRALITSYNMASAGPGRQLSLGAAVKPEFTPKDYAATVKSFTDAGFSPTDALIRADQLYGRGPAAANEDVDLQAADKAKGGKTNAPAEKVGLTTQPAAPAPAAQPPRPPNTVEAIQAANLQKLVPLANEFKAAEQQFVAAARSGDQKAIAQYLQKKEVLRQQLESQLEKQFGNTAPAAYKQLLSLGS